MSLRYARLGLAAFTLLTAGVAVNMLNQPASAPRLARVGAPSVDQTPRAVQSQPERPVVTPRTAKDGRSIEDAVASETIRAVQRELHARGYEPGTQDGVPGLVTRAAVLAFEEDHKLPLTAEPSENVLKAILLGGAPLLTGSIGTTERVAPGVEFVVRAVQQHLTSLGYQTRRTDGRLNPDTTRAIREFELDQGTPATGRITGPLMARLVKAAATRRTAR